MPPIQNRHVPSNKIQQFASHVPNHALLLLDLENQVQSLMLYAPREMGSG
jgi:hypothetical protein